MRNRTLSRRPAIGCGLRHVAAIVLAAVTLTQLAACGSTPRIQPKPLAHWTSPADCTTDYAAAVSGLSPDKGAAPALLVDSIGSVWNCMTIPEGRYDAEMVVRWSNGWQETALDVKGMDVASGQRLVVRAYERDKGTIPASFSDVRVHVEPPPAAIAGATPVPAPESRTTQAPAKPDSIDDAPAAALPDRAPSPGGVTAGESPHPAMTVLKIAGAVLIITAAIVLTRGEILAHLNFGNGPSRPGNTTMYSPQRTGPISRPAADCCFAWIEDGLTGKVIAGQRPSQNYPDVVKALQP